MKKIRHEKIKKMIICKNILEARLFFLKNGNNNTCLCIKDTIEEQISTFQEAELFFNDGTK